MLPFGTPLFQCMTSLVLHYERKDIIFCSGSKPRYIFLSLFLWDNARYGLAICYRQPAGNELMRYDLYDHLSQIFTCKTGGGVLKVIHNKHAF